MAFDGLTIAAIVKECNDKIVGGRIMKIAQPEQDELLLTIKNNNGQHRFSLSVDPSLPLAYFIEENKKSPMTAPNFCMVLRKHIQNGRIISVEQPHMERVIQIELEHLNELGDLCKKYLIIELMGKHSNIILVNETNHIVDSIKHISGMVSSVREVLPGRTYFIPGLERKHNPCTVARDEFAQRLLSSDKKVQEAIYGNITGISPLIAKEICTKAQVDYWKNSSELSVEESYQLYGFLRELVAIIETGGFQSRIYYENGNPLEYASIPLTIYREQTEIVYETISKVLKLYYEEKNLITRIRQKSVDLRRIVQTALERNQKKYKLQIKQLEDTNERDKYRIYGELLNAYGYEIKSGEKSATVLNYYNNEMITIPLDIDETPIQNAKRYFDKYGKLKRTYEALLQFSADTKSEIEHLESIMTSLDIAMKEEDLVQIKEELMESGYIRRRSNIKKEKITSKPFHYRSSSGEDIYVGKNNIQNEELTFKVANGNDWWFHAKGIPGSHVVVKANGEELSDATFEEAAALAAYYSKGRGQEKIEVDYIQRKHVKKPAGANLGFVIYHTNYSMIAASDISRIEVVE